MNWSFLSLLPFLAPSLLSAAHVPAKLINPIVNGMVEAEHLHEKGDDKKAHVLNIASAVIDSYNNTHVKTVDHEETIATISNAIDATIGGIKAFHTIHGAK